MKRPIRSPYKLMQYIPVFAVLLCAYGPCSPTSCPMEATLGPEQGCWFEFSPHQSTVSINAGELQGGLHDSSQLHSSPRYRFAFIQDPQEQVHHKEGRVGTWKLQIQTWLHSSTASLLKLSWHLRESRPRLKKHETVRLALSWLQQGKRQLRILPGHYNNNHNRLYALVSTDVLRHPQTYFYPVRLKSPTEINNYRASTQNPKTPNILNLATAAK